MLSLAMLSALAQTGAGHVKAPQRWKSTPASGQHGCGHPGRTALLMEMAHYHGEVLPSSTKLLQDLGYRCIQVWKSLPRTRDTRGDRYLMEPMKHDPGYTISMTHVPRNEHHIQSLLRTMRPALIFIQTVPLTDSNSARFWRLLKVVVGHISHHPGPLLLGCHNVEPFTRAVHALLRERPALFGNLVPVTFGPGSYAELRETPNMPRPLFLLPVLFPPVGNRARHRAHAPAPLHDHRAGCGASSLPIVRFICYSGVNRLITMKSFHSLLALQRWPLEQCVEVRFFGTHEKPDAARHFAHVAERLNRATRGRVRLAHMDGLWSLGLQWGLESDYMLPLVDNESREREVYSTGRKLASTVAMAIGLGKPLVVWKPLADSFGVANFSITYAKASGMLSAMTAGARMRPTTNYSRLQGHASTMVQRFMGHAIRDACEHHAGLMGVIRHQTHRDVCHMPPS